MPLRGSTSIVPPAEYWTHLGGDFAAEQLEELRRLSDERLNEFRPSALPPPEDRAVELLERVASDGWLGKKLRSKCPNCSIDLSEVEASGIFCTGCDEPFSEHGGVNTETVYVRDLAPGRSVDWVIAIHGMNTSGAWQEAFSWLLATTWGRSVPVAVYKYGIVIAGVLLAWRRRKLQRDLRDKLAGLRDEARAQGFTGNPDVFVHSFGTWLFGHMLRSELKRQAGERLRFGRVVLAGCILRPDFEWEEIRDAGLVEEVLNHYGTRDPVVPWAHLTIWNSGPSGRRGFDGGLVFNIPARGYGHSDLFSIDQYVVNGSPFQAATGGGMRHLDYAYALYWRPFLTLPREEIGSLPDLANPTAAWRPLPWPLRGTLFPFVALPLVASLLVLIVAYAGGFFDRAVPILWLIARITAAGLAVLLTGAALTALKRRLFGRDV